MPFRRDNYKRCSGELRNLERRGEYLFSVELWLLNDSANRNNWRYADLEAHKALFAGTPILIAYTNGGAQIGDGHNFREEKDPKTGEIAPSFIGATAERIVGMISEDEADTRLERRDGNTWIVSRGFLWRWYAKELVEKIERDARQGRSMSVSIETLVTRSHMEDGIEVEDEYKILGTTILGDHVMPAVADAHIAAITQREGFRELKMRAASYSPAEGGTKKPQKNSNRKGMKNLELFNRPQLDALQQRFDAFTVLCAGRDDAGVHVALRNDRWELFTYDMESETDTVAPERIASCAAVMEFTNGCTVDAYAMIADAAAEVKRLSAALDAAQQTVAERENAISTMREIEGKRRVSAAREIARKTLAAFNAVRDEKVAEAELEGICADIDSGIYTNSVNAEGIWTGDKAVEDRVYAVCARRVQEMEEQKAAKAKTTFVWQGGGKTDGGVEGLLERKGIR